MIRIKNWTHTLRGPKRTHCTNISKSGVLPFNNSAGNWPNVQLRRRRRRRRSPCFTVIQHNANGKEERKRRQKEINVDHIILLILWEGRKEQNTAAPYFMRVPLRVAGVRNKLGV